MLALPAAAAFAACSGNGAAPVENGGGQDAAAGEDSGRYAPVEDGSIGTSSEGGGAGSDATLDSDGGSGDADASFDGGASDANDAAIDAPPDAPPCVYTMSTLAGDMSKTFSGAASDGTGANARFRYIGALRIDPSTGDLLTTDNATLRRVTMGGVTTTQTLPAAPSGYANLGADANGTLYFFSALKLHVVPKVGAPTVLSLPGSVNCADVQSFTVGPDGFGYFAGFARLGDGGLLGVAYKLALDASSATLIWEDTNAGMAFTDLAVDGTHRVFIADANNDTVVRYTPGVGVTTLPIATFGLACDAAGHLFTPSGKIYDPDGKLRRDTFDPTAAYGAATLNGDFFGADGVYDTTNGWSFEIRKATGCTLQ